MSRWVDRVRNHSIWTSLGAVEPSIRAASEREGIDADMLDSLARLQTVITYGTHRVSSTDPALVPPQALDNLVQSVNQMKAHVDAFVGNGDINQLNAANAQAETFLVNLNLVFGPSAPEDIASISKAAADYRQTLEKHLASALVTQRNLLEKAEVNETRIQAIEVALTNEQQRLNVLINDQQSQFSAAQDRRASEFAASQAEYLAKYTAASTDQQTQFSTDQDARKSTFSTFQRENQEKLSVLMDEYDEKLREHELLFLAREKESQETLAAHLASIQTDYEGKAAAVLAEIDQHKKAVESLVGVIGNLGVTSGYKKVADYAKTMTLVWQFITVLALLGLIVVAAAVAFPSLFGTGQATVQKNMDVKIEAASATTSKATPDKAKDAPPEIKATVDGGTRSHSDAEFYQGFATRVFLSITFGIFAAYAGKQASRFFETERQNRKMALELEALGPFIEPLEKTERDKFRLQIGDRSFGVADHGPHKGKDDDPVTLAGWVKSKEGIEALTSPIKDVLKSIKTGG